MLANMQEIDICPTPIGISTEVEFYDFEIRAECCQESLTQSLVKVAVIIEQYTSFAHITHHPVSMTIFIVIIFRYQHYFCFQKLTQRVDKSIVVVVWILSENLVSHDDFITTTNDIAPINDNIGIGNL